MYYSKNCLTHLLEPHHYHSEEHHRVEMDRLFRPGWHLVGTTRELPHPGDYFTRELFGRPVLVRNMDGEIRAFENICCHRHCRIVAGPQGHSERLKCQYHGWEYRETGRTARIPEAKCFKPWDRENSRLHTFRVAVCGELIFVSLAGEGPSLAEYLGEFHERLAASFVPPYRPAWHWEVDFAADWKIPVENTIEHYHVPCLHPKTLKDMAPEESVTHVIDPRGSSHLTQNYHKWVDLMKNWMVRRLGGVPSPDYTHRLIYPNFVYIEMDTVRIAEAFIPTGPGTARQIVYTYSLQGPRRGPLARAVAGVLRYAVRDTVRKILTEDLPIFEQQQQGVAASTHPGVIGTLEERVYCFQKYVLESCYGHGGHDTDWDRTALPSQAAPSQAAAAQAVSEHSTRP